MFSPPQTLYLTGYLSVQGGTRTVHKLSAPGIGSTRNDNMLPIQVERVANKFEYILFTNVHTLL